jgi:hypothetical protein
MNVRTLLLACGVAFVLFAGLNSNWVDGHATNSPSQVLASASASVPPPEQRLPGIGQSDACGEHQGRRDQVAQACPPGTCPCRGGGCAQNCC